MYAKGVLTSQKMKYAVNREMLIAKSKPYLIASQPHYQKSKGRKDAVVYHLATENKTWQIWKLYHLLSSRIKTSLNY